MTSDRNALIIVGTVMMIGGVLIPLILMAAANDFWDALGVLIVSFFVAPVVLIIGLVLILVGASRGRKQQQQQQVIVINEAQAMRRGLIKTAACPTCGTALGGGEQFCTGCGTRLSHG